MESSKSYIRTFNYTDIPKIKFPIFKVPSSGCTIKDGIVWSASGRVIDDLNQPGKTIGSRRLTTPFPLCSIKIKKSTLRSMLNFTSLSQSIFIDSNGVVFRYKKTTFQKIKCHYIKHIKYSDTYCVLTLEGVNFPIKVTNAPKIGVLYANVIYINEFPWILYRYSYDKLPPRRKKI